MGFPKSYDDTKYRGRAQKGACKGTLPDGTQCTQKAIRGKSLCGHCLDRVAAEEQKQREAAREKK